MDFRTLSHAIVLSEELHFGNASSRVNISTSALSRTIRQLETELGATLFHRDNRSVELTPAGEAFVRYARGALQQWEQIQFDLAAPVDQLHGEISLYCSVTASHGILVELLNQFRPTHPGVEIRLQTGDPQHAIERVVDLEEDLAIAARPTTLPSGVEFKRIQISPLVFIAPAGADEVGNWGDVPMILASSGLARTRVDAWFAALGVTPDIYAQVAGNEAIVSMVSLGLGVGVVPKIVFDNSLFADRVRILDVAPTLEPYDLGLVTMKRNLNNPLVNAFWSLLSDG